MKKITTTIELTPRQLAAVLAGLRTWQATPGLMDRERLEFLREIASDGGTLKPLSATEIDKLCERINTTA